VFTNRLANLVSIGFLAAAPWLAAQEKPPAPPQTTARLATADPVLDGLVAEALSNNMDIVEADAAAQAAQQRIEPARTLPDPLLSLTYQNDGKSLSLGTKEMTFLGAMYVQPLPWPGKLKLAGEEAAHRADEVQAGTVGRARLGVEARVRRSYYDYLLARDELDLIEDRSRSWRQISEIARERYAVGLGVQQDVLRAQAEVLRLDEARAEQRARIASRLAEVNRGVGRAQETPIETAARLILQPAAPDLPALLQATRDRSPELAGVSCGIEAARLRVDLAKKNRLPDFIASGGPMYRGALDPMWQVGLAVSLPIFPGSRQRPLLAAAEADLRAEEARASSARQELELRTRERFESLTAALKIAGIYRDGVLPVDQLSLESAIASYRTGKVPFVTVLEALNTFFADRSLFLTRLAEAEKWRIAIDEANLAADSGMPTAPSASSAGAAPAGAMSSTGSMR
jgi:outer membrane protein TolC